LAESFRTFLNEGNYRRYEPDTHSIAEAEFDAQAKGVYGPLWVYLFTNTFCYLGAFVSRLSESNNPLEEKIDGEKIINANVLAYFDSLVALAPWDNAAKDGEKATRVITRIAEWQEEHKQPAAQTTLKNVLKDINLA
jgi:hypothetical protein